LLAVLLGTVWADQAALADDTDQDRYYELESTDPNVLYGGYSSAGGPQISTDTWHWGYCRVWITTTIAKSYAGGHVRNNPDGTFYPGDGFGYSFVYGWAGDPSKCRNLTVCPIKSNHILPGGERDCGIGQLYVSDKTASGAGRHWLLRGQAEISSDVGASGHSIQLQVNAERWGCHYPKNAPRACGWAQISATGGFAPQVLKPSVGLSLAHEYLYDADGYASGNLDGTYYLWDGINIVHNPLYLWKDNRVGTLSVRIEKTHDLKLEKEFQCVLQRCVHTLIHDGFEPWPREYEYGAGVTLYNATREHDIRKHSVAYKVEMYNLGKLIHKSENQTSPLVVVYSPIYESYPYLVLEDKSWWSWSHRQAVALEYKGSLGGGDGDEQRVHENRRSKINSYRYDGYAFDPVLRAALNETLSWSEASRISNARQYRCDGTEIDTSSFETGRDGTALFVKAGFGKISFYYPILKTMLEQRYINATINNTLQSASFAGHAAKDLTGYHYQYPDVKFSNPVKILTYRSDGSRADFAIEVSMEPDFEKGAEYIQKYTCDKVLHDTRNAGFANIAVLDMFGTENKANGTGYVNMKTHMTSIWFPPFYSVLAGDVLDLPIHQGYKALSPYKIVLKVDGKTRTINHMVNFLSPFVHVVNLDGDNPLNVTERSGLVRISADEKFGQVVRVEADGAPLREDCTVGCTTSVRAGQAVHIEAWNAWGGRAEGHIEGGGQTQDEKTNWDILLITITAACSALLLWRLYDRFLRHLGLRG